MFLTGFCGTLGAKALYPFERFTVDAKKTLTLAQEEAERSHHSYIGTEHMLLGLLRLSDGVGHQALVEMGIDIGRVRETIAALLGRNERITVKQIIPTSRVKKVIEISFDEARRMGQDYVHSGHILLGLVLEGEGIAAHVLQDLGATSSAVRATLERVIKERTPEGAPETWVGRDPLTANAPETDAETLARLLTYPDIANLLRGRGIADLEGLGARLGAPPPEVARLRAMLRDIRKRLERAEHDWLNSLTE